MTIRFLSQGQKNFNEENIIQIIKHINDPVIQNALDSNENEIRINGEIHASQFTSDNPENFFWFRLSVHDKNGHYIIGDSSLHIFVCFRLLNIKTNRFYPSKNCINPPVKNGTDIANIDGLFGFWEYKKITYGFVQQLQQNSQILVQNLPKQQKSKAITIFDPKTNKPINL